MIGNGKNFRCRSCGAPILWTVTVTGKNMPVDKVPSLNGNIMLGARHSGPPLALVQKQQQLEEHKARGTRLYVSHFATCKQSDKWRRD